MREPGRYYSSYRGEWNDDGVCISIADTDPGQRLELQLNYHTVWTEVLPAKVRRRGPRAVQAWAQQQVTGWIDRLDQEIAATEERRNDALRQSQDARDTAAATDIREPAELAVAIAELAEVNKAITAALARDDGAEAA